MPSLQALIFDVDGTIAESERDGHRVAFNRAFAEADLDWHWSVETYGRLLTVSGGKERLYYYLENDRPDFHPREGLDRFVVRLHDRKNHHYQELLRQGEIPLRPGVKRLIQEARTQGVRLAVSTTSAIPNTQTLLETLLDPDWFEVIAAGDMASDKKPAPDIYLYALEQLQLAPEVCLAIEDSQNGIEAALAANLPTIVTINGYTRDEDFTGARLVLDSLGEPDAPFQVLAGDVGDATYVDCDLARRCVQSRDDEGDPTR